MIRDTYSDTGARSRFARNTDAAAEQLDPFSHTRQSKMTFTANTRHLVWIKATAIILYHEVQVLILYAERHINMLRPGMLTGIGQSLLGDTIDAFLQACR